MSTELGARSQTILGKIRDLFRPAAPARPVERQDRGPAEAPLLPASRSPFLPFAVPAVSCPETADPVARIRYLQALEPRMVRIVRRALRQPPETSAVNAQVHEVARRLAGRNWRLRPGVQEALVLRVARAICQSLVGPRPR